MSRTPDARVRAIAHVAGKLAERYHGDSARRMHAELNRLRMGAEALDKLTVSRSPLDTEAAHTKKVATAARRYDQEVTAAMNRLAGIAREGRDALQRRIDEKVNLRPDAFAAEIRATFRTLSRKDKVELLSTLANENRGPELAAIIKAPSLLSGISDAERDNFEGAILSVHAATEMEQMAALDEALSESWAATGFAGDFATSLVSPGKVAAIEQGEAAAAAASDAFNQSLQ